MTNENESQTEFDKFLDECDAEWDEVVADSYTKRDTAADTESRELSGVGANRSTNVVKEEGKYKCYKCLGDGTVWFGYINPRLGKCFACNGKGFFKTSPETRKRQRDSRKRAEESKKARNAELSLEFLNAQPDSEKLFAWIKETRLAHESRPTDFTEFANDLRLSLLKYGSWTEKQIGAARKCIAASEKRTAERKENSHGPFVKLQEAFDKALSGGASRSRLKLTIGGLRFNRAPDTGRNPKCIYVKDGDLYVGKITPEGTFSQSRDAEQQHIDGLNAIGDDPLAEAKKHGHETGVCACCAKTLTNPDSIENGIGPICQAKWGW
tara:strand:+ start:350 stop:1321 length:972 start_codon:yes stop_codon:yes gene_type:complete